MHARQNKKLEQMTWMAERPACFVPGHVAFNGVSSLYCSFLYERESAAEDGYECKDIISSRELLCFESLHPVSLIPTSEPNLRATKTWPCRSCSRGQWQQRKEV
jgi:hypothetical protein